MDAKLIAKLDQVEARLDDLTAQLSDPAVLGDGTRYQKTARAHSELSELVGKYREWKSIQTEMSGAKAMLSESDPEMQAMAKEELTGLEPRSAAVEQELMVMLLPKDPHDDANV